MITCQFLNKADTLNVLPEFVEDIFNIEKKRVQEQIEPILSKLLDNIICFIEFPYVEKYYRDSFYSFYSKKHNYYERNSIRVSIFDEKLDHEKYFSLEGNEEIEKLFYGFITLRPTTYRIIGHSFIDPRVLKENSFVCCLSRKNVLINGRKLSVNGFPYISQDNESITCSEASIINLFDYFGNKYPEYSLLMPSQVNKILSRQSYQRQLPTQGLPTENISYVLKKLGFGTVVYSSSEKDKASEIYEPNEFKDLMLIYVESGIPIIATLSSGNNYHALLVIGREEISEDFKFKRKLFCKENNKHSYSSIFTKILVMNDNHPPYELIDYHKPIFDNHNNSYYKFQSFIVPLYSRVHLEAYQFRQFFFKIIENFEIEKQTSHIKFFEDKDICIYRFYLTSSKSYKNYIANSKTISENFKSIAIEKSMPKFIWVGEIIEGETISEEQIVRSIIIIDATESGLTGHLIYATNSQYLIIKNPGDFSDNKVDGFQQKYLIFDLGKEEFYSYNNNLKGKHTKWQN